MLYPQRDKYLCTKKYSKKEISELQWLIKNKYGIFWMVDNLPIVTHETYRDANNIQRNKTNVNTPVGFYNDGKYYLNNHIILTIFYHSPKNFKNDYRVVAAIMKAIS